MGRWLVVGLLVFAGCKSAAPVADSRYTEEWGKGFAAVASSYTAGGGPVPVPDSVPDACRCNGTGKITQPDGHQTDCLCGGPGKCTCVPVPALIVSSGKSETEWCRELAAAMGCDRETGVEVRLATGTRVDLINEQWAIECDWATKWAEGCGQALYYGACTGRKPGLLLLLKNAADRRYVERAAVVAAKYGIGLWVYDTNNKKWLVMFQRGKAE